MDGRITGFIVWAVFGCMFIGLAIYVWFQKTGRILGQCGDVGSF